MTKVYRKALILTVDNLTLTEQVVLLEKHIASDVKPHGDYWLHPEVYKLSCQQALEAMKQPFTVVTSTAHNINPMLHIRHYVCDSEHLYYIDSVRPFTSIYFVSAPIQFDGQVFMAIGDQPPPMFNSVNDAVAWIKNSQFKK